MKLILEVCFVFALAVIAIVAGIWIVAWAMYYSQYLPWPAL